MTRDTVPLGWNMPRAILFDWDNTLVDGWAAIAAALNAALTAFGQAPWSEAEVKGRVRQSLRDTFPGLFGERWQEARKLFQESYGSRHLEVLRPLDGAAEMIRVLAGQGPYLGVVSNKTGHFLRREAEWLGWSAHFGALVGAGDAARDKPHADPIHMALGPSGILAGLDVWYVGDTALDMQAARAAGCRAVLLGDASHDGGIAAAAPDLALPDCNSLAKVIVLLAAR
ncbi:MAG: HAD hydrolase-like protein [Alphaproteobacteria bacterium]|nr:HAD hydrolase-like protein [Alphaproteobacteria bacterium]